MNLRDLFHEGIQPETTKQLVPKPPTYEESLKDLLEGNKEFYIDPQYFLKRHKTCHRNTMTTMRLIMH